MSPALTLGSPQGREQLLTRATTDAGVLVLAATNRPGALDAALVRPGRLDLLLYVPPPDAAGRLATLRIHTRGMPLAPGVNLPALAAVRCQRRVCHYHFNICFLGWCPSCAACRSHPTSTSPRWPRCNTLGFVSRGRVK